MLHRFFRQSEVESAVARAVEGVFQAKTGVSWQLEVESCFYIESLIDLSPSELQIVLWLIFADERDDAKIYGESAFSGSWEESGEGVGLDRSSVRRVIEVGPRLTYESAFCTNALSICRSVGLHKVNRIEQSRRYRLTVEWKQEEDADGHGGSFSTQRGKLLQRVMAKLYDRMTECVYEEPITTFNQNLQEQSAEQKEAELQRRRQLEHVAVYSSSNGREALQAANERLGLALDAFDLDWYVTLFKQLQRDPTHVELFDLAQSNSEHSRHYFFKAQLQAASDGADLLDGAGSLFDLVRSTLRTSNDNSVVAFSDNASAIRGWRVPTLQPKAAFGPFDTVPRVRHPLFTAETHNFPTGVEPFEGAATGVGGRLRDVHACGRGSFCGLGSAGYCVGALNLQGYPLPGEQQDSTADRRVTNLASPLDVLVRASNGASAYGNQFGEPIVLGFARSFALNVRNQWREWLKPVMFTGGLGSLDEAHTHKTPPQRGMLVAKIGGPVYRIGVGGGAASSQQPEPVSEATEGDADAASHRQQLDFNAVQRGDPEMEQKLNRFVRACAEHEDDGNMHNPIEAIHDQGAGGNGNVLKEIVSPAGAVIFADRFSLGDRTIAIHELWNAEYQESDAVLLRDHPDTRAFVETIARRERCSLDIVGRVAQDGRMRLVNFKRNPGTTETDLSDESLDADLKLGLQNDPDYLAFDLQLSDVLENVPRKTFVLDRADPAAELSILPPLTLPTGLRVRDALERVLRLASVGSKAYLTNKVDRSVGGLVSQQQCVGPAHTPLADVACMALAPFTRSGAATSIGEQPIKLLLSPECGARLTLAEALVQLAAVRVTALGDVKCSVNWMWPAKLATEGARLVDACRALCDAMQRCAVACDGGKDSLSMVTSVRDKLTGNTSVVKSPCQLVVSAYVTVPDISHCVTPDLKRVPHSPTVLLYVNCWSSSAHAVPSRPNLGGTALAHAYSQLGRHCPDVLDQFDALRAAFDVTQQLLSDRNPHCRLLAAHDVSDGGLLTAALEMAFAGDVPLRLDMASFLQAHAVPLVDSDVETETIALEWLFSEEPALLLQVRACDAQYVRSRYEAEGVRCVQLGTADCHVDTPHTVSVAVNDHMLCVAPLDELRCVWEATSFELERQQCASDCVEQERTARRTVRATHPDWQLPHAVLQAAEHGHFVSRVQWPLCDRRYAVAVLREEGSNGDREMAAAFFAAGFVVHDVTMQDLLDGSVALDGRFKGLACVGGFSYADVFGSARGWAATVRFNPRLRAQFYHFRARSDTFSLGVCNGCQLFSLLDWLDEPQPQAGTQQLRLTHRLRHNRSKRFESRFPFVRVEPQCKAIMLRRLAGAVLGVWSAHGEGRFEFPQTDTLQRAEQLGLVALTYVAPQADPASPSSTTLCPTELYPFNPNGSPHGVAALCSADGRHLSIMPHPERCYQLWQLSYAGQMPNVDALHAFAANVRPLPPRTSATTDLSLQLSPSPWFAMFSNAYEWCESFEPLQ